jgi:hypothetical protein
MRRISVVEETPKDVASKDVHDNDVEGHFRLRRGPERAIALSSVESLETAKSVQANVAVLLDAEEAPSKMDDAKLAGRTGQREFCNE